MQMRMSLVVRTTLKISTIMTLEEKLVLLTVSTRFEDITLSDLAAMDFRDLDGLPFGVVGLDRDGLVVVYNATEAGFSGLDAQSMIGVPFFDAVAQCMNNFMVAQRFEDEAELDEIVPYVLTLRMRPTRVRLRMLAARVQPLHFILIEW
jgi:photoactive yellow protein